MDTLIFRPGPPVQRYFFAVSFDESDKIRLIDSPNPHVTAKFGEAVKVGCCFKSANERWIWLMMSGE